MAVRRGLSIWSSWRKSCDEVLGLLNPQWPSSWAQSSLMKPNRMNFSWKKDCPHMNRLLFPALELPPGSKNNNTVWPYSQAIKAKSFMFKGMPTEEERQKENTASVLKDVQDLHTAKEEEKAKGCRGAEMLLWSGSHSPQQGDAPQPWSVRLGGQ